MGLECRLLMGLFFFNPNHNLSLNLTKLHPNLTKNVIIAFGFGKKKKKTFLRIILAKVICNIFEGTEKQSHFAQRANTVMFVFPACTWSGLCIYRDNSYISQT